MSSKLARFITTCILILLVVGILLLWYWSKYATIIRLNWDIKLPYNYRESYDLETNVNMFGDGVRYHVFTYRNDKKLLTSLPWKPKESNLIQSNAQQLLKELNAPQEEWPDFTKSYLYYYTHTNTQPENEIYLLYFQESKTLYIIELLF